MNDETLQKNKIILQEKIREKYKDNEEEFFKDLQTTSQTFWKRYDNQKFPTKQIFKAKELLDLTKLNKRRNAFNLLRRNKNL